MYNCGQDLSDLMDVGQAVLQGRGVQAIERLKRRITRETRAAVALELSGKVSPDILKLLGSK